MANDNNAQKESTTHQQTPNQQQDLTLNDAQADMAQAFTDLLRGEKQATALESQLSSIEKKIDDLLAQADRDQRDIDRMMEEEVGKGGPGGESGGAAQGQAQEAAEREGKEKEG